MVRLPRARMPSLTQKNTSLKLRSSFWRACQRKFKSTFSYKKDFLSTHDSGQERHVTHNIPGLGEPTLEAFDAQAAGAGGRPPRSTLPIREAGGCPEGGYG